MLAKLSLIAVSLIFYGFYGGLSFAVLMIDTVVNWFLSRLLCRESGHRKVLLFLSVTVNVLLLLYFKYWDFFAVTVHADEFVRNIALPMGISFYTFQQIAWLVDSYRGETGDYSPVDYAVFVLYFPKLVMGPIILHDEFIPQLNDEKRFRVNYENLSVGFLWFVCGLFKKTVLSGIFNGGADWGFSSIDTLTLTESWLCAVSYSFQLYFDFSGYCDMALGISRMFNLDLPINFNSPYKSLSITEFWKGWHMTLTRFLRKYIYFPFGGSRKGTFRTYLNIMIIFVISGFWHGAEWTFIIWGALHGVVMVLNRMIRKQWDSLHAAFRWIVNFLIVVVGWVFFRADNISDALKYLGRMADTSDLNLSGDFYNSFGLYHYPFIKEHLNLAIPFVFAVALFMLLNTENVCERKYKPGPVTGILAVILFLGCFMMMSDVATFVYFAF